MLFVLGGSEAYTGRDMHSVHRRMVQEQGLAERHFDRVLQVGAGAVPGGQAGAGQAWLVLASVGRCWRVLAGVC